MAQICELWLPESHANLMTDMDHYIHEAWANSSAGEIAEDMEDPTVVGLSNGDTITYNDLRVEGDQTEEAVALVLPFNNRYTLSNHIRPAYAQSVIETPTRFMVFPNGKHAYDLNDQAPIEEAMAAAIAEAAERAGVKKLHIVGYSQGATVGAAMLKLLPDNFDISDSGVFLGDPPNVVEGRTEKQLSKDFKGDGLNALRALNKAINDSSLPALSEAQRSRGGLDAPLQMLGLAQFGLSGSLNKANKRFHTAMTQANFVSNIEAASALPARLVVARMAASLICPELWIPGHNVEVVDDYGHEGADNVVLHALLARLAVVGRQQPYQKAA